MLFFSVLRTALQGSDNFDIFNFLMRDNSLDMVPPALDNGEPNSTMANQIVYSPKETILMRSLCTSISTLISIFNVKTCIKKQA